MKKRVIPVIASTMEGLENALFSGYPVVCVEKALYVQERMQIRKKMRTWGYATGRKKGENCAGVYKDPWRQCIR